MLVAEGFEVIATSENAPFAIAVDEKRRSLLAEASDEAQAEDDYGIDRLDLVYSVRGGAETTYPEYRKKIKGWTMSPSHFQGTALIDVWLDE